MKVDRRTAIFILILQVSLVLPSLIPSYYYFIRQGMCLLGCLALFIVIDLIVPKNKVHGRDRLEINIIDVVFILFIAYQWIRYLFTPEYHLSIEKVLVLGALLIIYLVLRCWIVSRRATAIHSIFRVIVFFGVFQSLYAFGQWFYVLPNLVDGYRMGGTFGNPGDLANYLVIAYSISLSQFREDSRRKFRTVYAVCSLLIVQVIFLSYARTAWIAAGVTTIYIFKDLILEVLRNYKEKHSSAVYVGKVSGFLISTIGVLIFLFYLKHNSSLGRLFIWKQSAQIILEKPVFGHGYNSFITVYNKHQSQYFRDNPSDIKNGLLADDIQFAYNDYIQIGVEYGLVGIVLIVVLFWVLLNSNVKTNRTAGNVKHSRAPIIGLATCMMFSYPLQNYSILLVLTYIVAIQSSMIESAGIGVHMSAKWYKVVRPIIYSTFVAIFLMSVGYVVLCLRWKHAYEFYAEHKKVDVQLYEVGLKYLKFDHSYLYNYGSVLYNVGEYEKCIQHFEQYYNYCYNIEMLLKLGRSYEEINAFSEAELYYQRATLVKPHLFIPKYHLFTLYKQTNQQHKAIMAAHEIKNMPVKVFSPIVKQIKTDANLYLNEENRKYSNWKDNNCSNKAQQPF